MPTSKNFRQMMTARPKELFFNDVQSRVLQLMPKTLVCEWGRGTGKGVVEAGRILYAVQHMPGSCLGMVAPSVKRCQTNILPSALVHLEEWGYKRDVHYIVGKKPWKALHWQEPHFQPMNWENTVAFYNGSYLNIISQDRSGTSNSLSLDHVFIDEAKFIDWEQLNNETLPANRGNKQLFGDCCLHHGLTITSDTSATKKGSWFMSWEKKQDKELVATMETVLVHLHSIRNKLAAHPERYDYYMKEVQKYEKILDSLRSYALVYSRCSSIQNLAVLGKDFIRQMKRDLPKMTFLTSIMCQHVGIAQDGFYSGLDEDRNFYTARTPGSSMTCSISSTLSTTSRTAAWMATWRTVYRWSSVPMPTTTSTVSLSGRWGQIPSCASSTHSMSSMTGSCLSSLRTFVIITSISRTNESSFITMPPLWATPMQLTTISSTRLSPRCSDAMDGSLRRFTSASR